MCSFPVTPKLYRLQKSVSFSVNRIAENTVWRHFLSGICILFLESLFLHFAVTRKDFLRWRTVLFDCSCGISRTISERIVSSWSRKQRCFWLAAWLRICKSPIATANILPFNIICRYFGAAIRLRMPEQKCFRFHLHGLHSCTFVFTLLSYIRFGTPAGQAFMFCCGQRAEPCGGSANVLR